MCSSKVNLSYFDVYTLNDACISLEIHFRVPYATPSGEVVVGHVRIAATKSEVDVRNSLHTTISCEDLNAESMPDLHCKLSKDVKAHRFVLDTDNWEHLKLE